MKRIAILLAWLLCCAAASAQNLTLPANTVFGRLGISAGPGQAIPIATLGSLITSKVVTVTGAGTASSGNCNGTYALGGGTLYTFTVPSAGNFAPGCKITLSDIDAFPAYGSSTFNGTISGATLTVTSGTGPTALGESLAGPNGGLSGIPAVTACPSGVCGGTGSYTISSSQTLGSASFTGTVVGTGNDAILIDITSVTGTVQLGDVISGTGVPAGTKIISQFSGTAGGAGRYVTSAATTASSASITATPTLTAYAVAGGRGKFISGVPGTTILYPGQSITITALGSAWDAPQIVPRLQIPFGTSPRFFISSTGNDTTGDGLGGCGAGGAPFATLQGLTNWLSINVDLRGIDPFTIQVCPGSYAAGTQETHFPVDIPGRNGGAGIRITGSPGDLATCANPSAVTLTSANSATMIDAQLPYVWLLADCMTLVPTNGAAIGASRGAWVTAGTGLVFGAGNSPILIQSGGTINFDDTVIFTGDAAGGFAINLNTGTRLQNIANANFVWNTGASHVFNYANPILLGQADADFGAGLFVVNGSFANNAQINEGRLIAQNAVPVPDYTLLGNSCVAGAVSKCSASAAGGSAGQVQVNIASALAGVGNVTSDGASMFFASTALKIVGASTGNTTIVSDNAGASNFTAHLPAANDTFALLAAAQTLTNKTISCGANTCSNIPNGALTNSSVTIAGVSVSLGGSITATQIAAALSAPITCDIISTSATTCNNGGSSANNGTYTVPSNTKYLIVWGCGGGGGGAGSGTTPGAPGAGGNTTFGTSLLTANGGGAGLSTGSPSTGGTATGGDTNLTGGSGGTASGTVNVSGGTGGNSFLGGGGPSAGAGAAGVAAAANSCSGGGGASDASVSNSGGGGAAGGYFWKLVTSPSATYAYAAGAAGTAGTAGTSGLAGSAGATGHLRVTAYFQ